MRKLLLRLAGNERAATAVEFAVAAPILVAFVLGLAEMGLAVNEKMRLTSAARAGAQQAYADADDTAAIDAAVRNSGNLTGSGLTVTVTESCGCADGTGVACDVTCSDGSVKRTYVTVSVAETHAFIASYPGIGSTMNLSAAATLRVK